MFTASCQFVAFKNFQCCSSAEKGKNRVLMVELYSLKKRTPCNRTCS